MDISICLYMYVLGLFFASVECLQDEIAGSNVTLVCPLQGSFTYPTWSGPPGSTLYIKEGQETSPTHPWVAYADNKKDLVISDAKLEYSGDYICEKAVFGSATVTLSVMAKPVVELANKTGTEPYSRFTRNNIITGFEDKNLTVFCSATGGRPMPKVEILVNNSAIEGIDFPDERVETKRVESDQTTTVIIQRTFTAKRKYDMTEILCKATNPDPNNILSNYAVTDTSTLYFSLKPLLHSYSGGGSTMVGESRNFSVEAQMGRPPPTFTWTFDGEPITADRFQKYPIEYVSVHEKETITAGQTTSLRNATKEDNKKIVMVTIHHEALDVPYKGDNEVYVSFGPSSVTITGNKPVYADEGATLMLTCTTDLVSFPNNYTIKWMNDTLTKELWYKRPLNRTDMWVSTPGEYNAFYVSENITLTVNRYMDGQSISCETSPAEDWHKTVLDTAVLDINYEPILLDPFDTELRVAEEEEVTLLCSAWSKPPSTFSWYKEGSNEPLVAANGTVKRNSISYSILRASKTSHNGTYRCVASNREGHSVEKQITLIVSDGPVVPALDFYSSDTDSVTIHYIAPELQPAQLEKVTYYLQYRLDGDSSSPWHEVMLDRDSNEFKLNHLKPGTTVKFRIKATNRDGSRYTHTIETRTPESIPADDITQKDVNIAIIVSVIVTAVVVLIVVAIVVYACRKRKSFDPSRRFEMDTASPLKT